MTWVVFDIHVDGGSDHTAVLVRLWVIQVDSLGAGDATAYITRRRTCGRRWLYEAVSSGAPLAAPLALPNKGVAIIWI